MDAEMVLGATKVVEESLIHYTSRLETLADSAKTEVAEEAVPPGAQAEVPQVKEQVASVVTNSETKMEV